MQNKLLLLPLSVFAFTSVFAQKVSISKIDESRSTSGGSFMNRCEIELKISGDEVRKHKFAKISALTKVTDDQGLNLLKPDKDDFKYEVIDEDAKVKIETKIPARKATVIKEIAGELSFYTPTEADGSVIKIADYEKRTNINLTPKIPGFQLIYLTKESLLKYQEEQKLKKEEELKKMPEVSRKLAESLLGALESLSSMFDDPNQMTFYIDGDRSKLVDLFFEDAGGKRISWNGRAQSNELVTFIFDEAPTPGSKLVLNVETPGSVKKLPFKLTDVELP